MNSFCFSVVCGQVSQVWLTVSGKGRVFPSVFYFPVLVGREECYRVIANDLITHTSIYVYMYIYTSSIYY